MIVEQLRLVVVMVVMVLGVFMVMAVRMMMGVLGTCCPILVLVLH